MHTKIVLLYKRIDHETKTKSHDCYVVCLPYTIPHDKAHEMLVDLKDKIYAREEKRLIGYNLVCLDKCFKDKEMLIGNVMTPVMCKVRCEYVYAKGDHPCDHGAVHTYKYMEGIHDHLEYIGGTLKLKAEQHMFSQTGGKRHY